MKPEEKLRAMMLNYTDAGEKGAADGDHLRDEDFIQLTENKTSAENQNSSELGDKLSPLRTHLANCDFCLAQFKDFYAFFAPAEPGENVAGKSEIEAAWQAFSPRISNAKPEKSAPKFWAKLFSVERKPDYFAAFGWGFAALLLFLTGFSVFIAWQARDEKSRIVGEVENQKQAFEERLKTLEQEARNDDLAEQEKTRLAEEKDELQKRVAALQTELEQAKQAKTAREKIISPPSANQTASDNSLVAVNTPIYDVFPADSVVRGNASSSNKFAVPNKAKTVVLILNAAGREEFQAYQAELVSNSGKTIWRGGGLRKDSNGSFTLTLSGALLKNGNYKLKLFGKNSGSAAQAIAEYPITIETK